MQEVKAWQLLLENFPSLTTEKHTQKRKSDIVSYNDGSR